MIRPPSPRRRSGDLTAVSSHCLPAVTGPIQNWRGRDGNDPSVDIAKDADQRF